MRPDFDLVTSLAEASTCLLDQPIGGSAPNFEGLSRAMLITWCSRPDLQKALDIWTAKGREQLRRWCLNERAGRSFHKRLSLKASVLTSSFASKRAGGIAPGVNLVGYAEGILGMGEHVRMSALAMSAAHVPGGMVNLTLGLGRRRQSVELGLPLLRSAGHQCNLFHINADQMPRAYWHLGGEFFAGHYNIGYWAWELAGWPREWVPTIGMVDEIWAPSRFICDAIRPATGKPVEWMPLCVEVPRVPKLPRSEFGLSDGDYVFLFTFDGHSYFDRKNPVAVVRAFQKAFPREPRARLVIKAMNTEVCAAAWEALIADTAFDDRIQLFGETWPRDRVLALLECSDAYVSLHRSEGFGRGPAEAMLLGKPVIVTDYSGTKDFCSDDNALTVKYDLVAVDPDSYVGAAGQVWADPSIECAAHWMCALFDDRTLGPRIGAKGRRTISEEFSAVAIGRRYHARLVELGMI